MTDWTIDKVRALAPDASSASAGEGLATARKWTSLGASDRALWGLCQGSGKDPYQTRVDLAEPVSKCSCPSRKFPCKHALGLLLLFAKEPKHFKHDAEPGWVSDWLASRAERAEKKADKAKTAAATPVDPAAQAARAAARDDRVRQGVAECRTWLDDLLRRGLASAQSDAPSECTRVAARMVDAQAPGLAAMIRAIPNTMLSGHGWEVRTLAHLARVHLLLRAAERLTDLPAPLAIDVRTTLGYTQSKDDVLAQPTVRDRWTVLGQTFEDADRLTVRRTWLWGEKTAQPALVLDFAVANQPLDTTLVSATTFEGDVCFYPSAAPLRALIKSRGPASHTTTAPPTDTRHTIPAQLTRFAHALAANPWLASWPMLLPSTFLARDADRWFLHQGDAALPLAPSFCRSIHLWRLLSTTAAHPATIVATWDGDAAEPLAVFTTHQAPRYTSVAARWTA